MQRRGKSEEPCWDQPQTRRQRRPRSGHDQEPGPGLEAQALTAFAPQPPPPAQPEPSTPSLTSAATRSSAAVADGTSPIRAATSRRREAPSLPPASRSARNAANGRAPGSTTSPGTQSRMSGGNSARSYDARSGTEKATGRSRSR